MRGRPARPSSRLCPGSDGDPSASARPRHPSPQLSLHDLDTTAQGLGKQNQNAFALYSKFQRWERTPGSWQELIELAVVFMTTDMVS